MILRTETVEQVVDAGRVVTLVKEVVMTPGEPPLGMVRKRLPPPHEPRGVVLLVHGFAQNRYTWHNSYRSFSSFLAAEGWDVFNVDLRGHGRSRRFDGAWAETMDDHVLEDLPACTEEAMRLSGASGVFLIGHSMGGMLGYCAAGTTLKTVLRGLITLGSPYRFGRGSWLLVVGSLLVAIADRARLVRGNPALPLRFVGRDILRRSSVLWNLRVLPSPIRAWSPGSVEQDVLDEYLSRAFDWTSLRVAVDLLLSGKKRRGLRGRDGLDYRAAFERFEGPVLVIAGSHDTLARPQAVRPAYDRSRSGDRSYRVFPLGHIDLIVGREAPATTWTAIAQWLARR